MLALVDDPRPRVTEEKPARWVLAWQPERDYGAPFEVELRGRNLRVLVGVQWLEITCLDGDGELTWRTPQRPSFNDVSAHNPSRAIARFRFASPVCRGDRVRFAVTGLPDKVAEASLDIRLVPLIEGAPPEGEVTLTARAGPARSLRVIARPAAGPTGRVRVVVQPQDALGYPTSFAGPVPLTLAAGGQRIWQGVVQGEKILDLVLPVQVQGQVRLTARICCSDLPDGDDVENGERIGPDAQVVSNPIWPRGDGEQIPAFGAIHWHTRLSGDGMRSMEQALVAARDHVNLDFAAPGDHTPRGEKWNELVRACDAFDEPGVFATLFGWEQSSDEGHVNFYFVDADHAMGPDHFNYPSRPAEYIETLSQRDFLAIPHHTNAVSYATRDDGSHYWRAYPWGKPREAYLRLVEIFQGRGNFEREDPPGGWRCKFRNNDGSVQTALALGHRLGFVGGTDNHAGWPARIFVHRETTEPDVGWILTGAWIAARTREAVYDALWARRTWACWDTRAIVRFTVGGALQGSELRLLAPRVLTARVRMSVERPLDVLEVVSEGDASVPVDVSGAGLDVNAEVNLGRVENDTFFYLRARQNDGALIYASPVFVTLEQIKEE